MKASGIVLLAVALVPPAIQAQTAPPAQQVTAAGVTDREFTVPEPYVERVRKQGAVLELSLKEAIRLALTNNLQIAIENYNEDLSREMIVKNQGFYDPALTFTVGYRSVESPTTSSLDAGGSIASFEQKLFVWNSSLQQNVKGGGQLQLSWNNDRSRTNSQFSFINPQFGSDFTVSFVQPLWRGFQLTSTDRAIKLANLDTRISDSQFKQRVAGVVERVQSQYWELVYAVENYETQRKSMELAIIQHRNNRKRVQIGVMAPIEITSSEAEVARREQGLIQSEVQIISSQNALKALLAPDPQASIWDLALIPLDRPDLTEINTTLKDSINTALARRPELEGIQYQLEQTEINRRFYRRDGKPSVDLRANFGSTSAAGQVFTTGFNDLNGNGVPDPGEPTFTAPNPGDPRFGNFTTAWTQAFGFDFINWGVFVDVRIPLRNRSNDADLAMNGLRERQLQSTVKNEQQAIVVEVRNAFETIQTRKKSLDAARVARQLAEEQLAGENKRFEAGLSTNFEVLRFQRDLAENQVSELRAMIDYQLALIALQQATYTIVEDSDIDIARGGN